MAVELDVVVDVDPRFRPATKFEAMGGKRFQSRSIQLLKQAGPATGSLFEGSVVQLVDQFAGLLYPEDAADGPAPTTAVHWWSCQLRNYWLRPCVSRALEFLAEVLDAYPGQLEQTEQGAL